MRKLFLRVLCLFVIFCGQFYGCGKPGRGETWEVLLGAIPKTISSKDADQDVTYYIIKQTHEPLLRQGDGTRYQSRILTKWSRNIPSSEYTFCPDTTLVFDAKTPFSLEYFYAYLKAITRKYSEDATLAIEKDCVSVKFHKSQPGYLIFLTRYENAPSIPASSGIETGLGPYYVKSLGQEVAVLRRKVPVKGGYNTIVIHAYHGQSDPNLKNGNISDFNRISSYDQPAWIKESFLGFSNPELKSVNLIINHPDKEIRRRIYNCINVDDFRQAFMPQRKDFYAISTILPLGIKGARPGKPEQVCKIRGLKQKVSVSLLNQQWDNGPQLQKYTDNLYAQTGLRLSMFQPPQQRIVEMLHGRKHPYNLAVVVTGASYWDYNALFQYYASAETYFDQVPENIRVLYKQMRSANSEEKGALAEKIADELAGQYMVLTLYQTAVKFYYPKSIKNLLVGRGFLEVPEIADFRF